MSSDAAHYSPLRNCLEEGQHFTLLQYEEIHTGDQPWSSLRTEV